MNIYYQILLTFFQIRLIYEYRYYLSLDVIDNFYLKKLTVSYNGKSILDIFNTGTYELIPYLVLKLKNNQTDNIFKIGSLFVLMQYRLIDIWIFNLLYNLSSIDKNFMIQKIKEIKKDYNYCSKLYEKSNFEQLKKLLCINLNTVRYIGTYEDESLKLRRAVSQLVKIAPRYYILAPKGELQQSHH